MERHYDIIGDIHGYASRLECLLHKLGYESKEGVFSHPARQAIFIGDYIDRGPEILRTLQIIRSMVEKGSAKALMGNHEFNAIAYATLRCDGDWLRPHTDNHYRQHSATLQQIASPLSTDWCEWLDWFIKLPLALDLQEIRAVHAAWNPQFVSFFRGVTHLTSEMIELMVNPLTFEGRAREFTLSGVKIAVPADRKVNERRSFRVKWWADLSSMTYRDAAFSSSENLPDELIPSSLVSGIGGYGDKEPPLFIGHYRLPFMRDPEPIRHNIACLDYDVHAGGPLVAYSWRGEKELTRKNYVTA